jgi:hypothetical protein
MRRSVACKRLSASPPETSRMPLQTQALAKAWVVCELARHAIALSLSARASPSRPHYPIDAEYDAERPKERFAGNAVLSKRTYWG